MSTRARMSGEKGLAVIMTGLLLIPLMTFAAFGVDLASWYSRVSYLQKSADAASLAGTVWMPNLSQAKTVACESLKRNGIVGNGASQDCQGTGGGYEVEVDRGSRPTSVRVSVTDPNAKRYFSQVLGSGAQRLQRSAEAEYNLPLPLGSPLNYFGGDATQANLTTVTSPTDYASVQPLNYGCNIGTSAGQRLGRWMNAGDWNPTGHTDGDDVCQWGATGTEDTSGRSTVPPPDHRTRAPIDGQVANGERPCNVFGANPASGLTGRWTEPGVYESANYTGTEVGNRPCTWYLVTTTGVPSYATSTVPINRPCNIGYLDRNGRWPATGAYEPNARYTGMWNAGNVLCRWGVTYSTTNVIDSTRSPGFWAQIHGPGADQHSGDAYSTRCETATNCGTPDNDLYLPESDPNQGYWYVVKIPTGASGSTRLRIFDAQLSPGALTVGTGDSAIVGGTMSFNTSYRVYKQTNALDFNSRTPVTTGGANQNTNSCNWSIQQQDSFRLRWVDLCTVNAVAGEIYLINVRTSAISGIDNNAGRNGYALEACRGSDCTSGVQPSLYAYDKMVQYNNIPSGDSTFYIAEVGPQYAGKTLILELFDPGETTGTAWLYPRKPSATQPGAVNPVPTTDCEFESTRSGYPRASDLNNGGVCSVRTAEGGALFGGHWVTMRISIPATYNCTVGINPVTTAGSCWWGIRYSFSGGGSPTDTTTWQARIEGNPVRLTE